MKQYREEHLFDRKMISKIKFYILVTLLSFTHPTISVEVHFEAADSGFFLKHSKQPPVAPEISNVPSSAVPPTTLRKNYDAILSVDRFTVVQTTQPVSIRASYGPFSTKQTVPARYIVPDAVDNKNEYLNNTTAALMELQQSNMHLDISAHLVRPAVSQDSPVLRVLFHAGADPRGHLQRQKICVLLHVSMGSMVPLKGRCMPEGEDGVCVAEVIIPSNWWPALPPPLRDWKNNTPHKAPQRFVQVSYSVFEPPIRNPEQCEPKIQIQPLTSFAQVPLVPSTTTFKEIRADESLTVLIPQYPLYPKSKLHVPVFLHQSPEVKISAFTMKARVKNGIKILGATTSSELWNISTEKENQKHTTARVTAFKIDAEASEERKTHSDHDEKSSAVEVFSWLLEIADDTLEGGKIVWSVQYVFENDETKEKTQSNLAIDESRRKLVAKLEVNKDDIQAVLPMAKNWELMNTAVLTGRQVAQAMKVFIVSQAGKVADVTLQSSCHAEDESVIKVSSSCSSVYVDGSEIRGSSNASVIVKYGTYVGLAKFVVWMPEFPLEVYISDFRLSQIKGWKVIDENMYIHKQSRRRKKRSFVWNQHGPNYYNNISADKMTCRARYQQSPVEVYARFLAIDQNSGRISYFISRRTGLCVTDLVQPLLRVADPKIATLKGRILQGKSMGRTDVQVLSPITGRVIGAKEVRVGSDKVSISKLIVNVVSGLQLTITPDNTIENGYISETSVTHKLTAQYQEGLLDIDLGFSDGSKTPLRDVAVEDYFLLVESLDTEVVAFAPMLASHHPRVIAVGEGHGNLLRVTLLLSEDCRARRNPLSSKQNKVHNVPLASALASVEVDFDNVETVNKQDVVQNDGIIGRERKPFRNSGDLADIIVGTPMRDASHHQEPTIQARQHRGNIHFVDSIFRHSKKTTSHDLTSMEIGMYVLLTAFCFAIIVFVISCVVYASKFRPISMDPGSDQLDVLKRNGTGNLLLHDIRLPKEPTTNAHDWVWLGRSTLDRSSVISNATVRDHADINRDWRMRITSNPFVNLNNIQQIQHPETFGISKAQGNCIQESTMLGDNFIESNANQHQREYRPPVPPHRNIGVCANFQGNNNIPKDSIPKVNPKSNHIRNRSVSHVCKALERTEEEPILPDFDLAATVGQLQEAQQSPEQIFSPQEINLSTPAEKSSSRQEMHNAEKLIERMNHHQKNAFQFDSLTPKRKPDKNESNSEIKEQSKDQLSLSKESKNEANANEGTFVASNKGAANSRKSRVKRATVVGNPMFSTSEDEVKTGESLGLDDLDMDYEQIMHYFHNLKESNA